MLHIGPYVLTVSFTGVGGVCQLISGYLFGCGDTYCSLFVCSNVLELFILNFYFC